MKYFIKKNSFFLFMFSTLFSCGNCGEGDNNGVEIVPFDDVVFEACDDGKDNDNDGYSDCFDPDCQSNTNCRFEPKDPSTFATQNDAQTIGNFWESNRFLVEGETAIVRNVDPDRLNKSALSVLRVRLLDRDGNPVSDIKASIVNHPEYGYTFSRTSGEVDFLVNAGGRLVVRFDDQDIVPVDIAFSPPQNAFSIGKDAVLTPLDKVSTKVGSDAIFTEASESEDVDGKRKLRVFFHEETIASAQLDDGRIAILDSFTLRATEYSTGPRGIDAMPGELPQLSAYTYAAELSIDELREVGVENVKFSKPVYLYLDNFLNFPIGSIVPSGFYDREANQSWKASKNGIVIQRVSDGIDTDGDNKPESDDTLKELGFSSKEILTIVETYSEGSSLWRVPVEHFSPYDLNWPQKFPEDALPLEDDELPDFPPDPEEENCIEDGSIVECQSQTLGKAIPIPGTDMKLWYRSDRVPGRGHQFIVHVSGNEVPSSLLSINATITVAGKNFTKSFDPNPNLRWEFEWDGLDAYQREVSRDVPVLVKIDYVYPTQYVVPAEDEEAFAKISFRQIVLRNSRLTGVKSKTFRGKLGALNAKAVFGLGGWMLDLSTYFLGETETLYLPDRPHNSKVSLASERVRTFADFDTEDGLLYDILRSPNGDVYLMVSTAVFFGGDKIFKLAADGSYTFVAGKEDGGEEFLPDCFGLKKCGTGGDPKDFVFVGTPEMGSDGAIYYGLEECIRRFDPEEMTYEDWAGECAGDTQGPEYDFMAGCEKGLYVTSNEEGIWLFDANGDRKLVAGFDHNADFDKTYKPERIKGPALGKALGQIISPTCSDDGDLFWFDEKGSIIKLEDGNLFVYWANYLEGADPLKAIVPIGLEKASVGGPYMLARQGQAVKIFKSEPNQLRHIVGAGFDDLEGLSAEEQELLVLGENIPANETFLVAVAGFVEQKDGSLLIADRTDANLFGASRIRIVESALSSGNALIDPSGNTLYFINNRGLPEKNVNARTGITNYEVLYNDAGFVKTILRHDGLKMSIERDAEQNPTAIVGYFGIRTELSVNKEGYIDSMQFADQNTHKFIYKKGGLLTEHTDFSGAISTYDFDKSGGLSRIDRPDGSWKTLSKDGNTVTLNTSSGREVIFGKDGSTSGKSVTNAAGITWVTMDDGTTRSVQHPDGSIVQTTSSEDPRFGSQASFTSTHITEQPSGLKQEINVSREVELSDPADLLSVISTRDIFEKGGKKWTTEYIASSKKITKTSPMGRKSVYLLDDAGRVIESQIGRGAKTTFTHSPGLLDAVQVGNLSVAMTYNDQGYLTKIASANQTVDIDSNTLGQITALTQGGETTHYSFDKKGHISEISTSNPWMQFDWNPVGDMTARRFADGAEAKFEYSENGAMTKAEQAGIAPVIFEYDGAQRLVKITDETRESTTTYDAVTGFIAQTNSPTVQTNFSYDGSLRTHFETKVNNIVTSVERTFNNAFGVSSRIIDGKPISYSSDDDGLLIEAGQAELTWRDDAEILLSRKVGSVRVDHTYNDLGQRTASTWTGPNAFSFTEKVTIDDNFHVEKYEEQSTSGTKIHNYFFDAKSQLVRSNTDGNITTYAFDDVGNRTAVNALSQTYDSSGRLETVGAKAYRIDLAGRMTKKETDTFSYDGFNQLLTVNMGATTIDYGYDMAGNRVSKTRNGVLETIWMYDDGLRPLGEFDGNGDLVARFTFAENESVPAYIEKNGKTYVLVSDYLGSVRFVIDVASGDIVQRLEYDAWGIILVDTNPGFQPFAYAGSMYDEDTGLSRMGVRDYDAESGRFTTGDPSGLVGGINPWIYVGGNPVSRVDPRGEHWLLAVAAALGVGFAFVANVESTTGGASNDVREISGELGDHNGPRDALRHCTMNCRMTRKHGLAVAKLASWSHEVPFLGAGEGNTPQNPERIMDEHNNKCGQDIAQGQAPDKSCLRGCEEALLNGSLRTLDAGQWNGDQSRQFKLDALQTWRANGTRSPFTRSDLL